MAITADFPSNPRLYDTYEIGHQKYQFNGQGWVPVPSRGPTYIQPNAPVGALPGDLWWKSEPPHMMYIYVDNGISKEWVPAISGSEGVESVAIVIAQTGHGFTNSDIGTPVYFNGSTWQDAIANSADTIHIACVKTVIDSDRFEVCLAGYVDNIAQAVNSNTPLEAGHFYRLSSTAAGKVTRNPPGQMEIFAPVFIAVSADSAIVLPYRAGKGIMLARSKQTWINVKNKRIFDFKHNPGRLEVYINGVFQHSASKFTSNSDGTQFTLALAIASENDVVEAIADSEVSYANTYTRSEADVRFPIRSWSAAEAYYADQYVVKSGNLVKAITNPTAGVYTSSQWSAVPVNAEEVSVVISTVGVAEPENPLAGDPFNTYRNAIRWLDKYVNYSIVNVSIQGGSYAGSWYIPPNKTILVTALGAVTINVADGHGMNVAGAIEWMGSPLTINCSSNTLAVSPSKLYTVPWQNNFRIAGITLHGNGIAWFDQNLVINCTGSQASGIATHSPGSAFVLQTGNDLTISATKHALEAGASSIINIATADTLTITADNIDIIASLGGQIWMHGVTIVNNSTTKEVVASDRGFIIAKTGAFTGWNTVSPAVGTGMGNHGSEIYYST